MSHGATVSDLCETELICAVRRRRKGRPGATGRGTERRIGEGANHTLSNAADPLVSLGNRCVVRRRPRESLRVDLIRGDILETITTAERSGSERRSFHRAAQRPRQTAAR